MIPFLPSLVAIGDRKPKKFTVFVGRNGTSIISVDLITRHFF